MYQIITNKLFVILIIFSSLNFYGQQIKKTQDLGLWSSVNLEYKLNKDFKIKFVQDIRFFESLTELDKYISEVGTAYKLNKNVKLSADLRYFLNKENDKTISQNWRYNIDLKSKIKIVKGLKLNYRLRFQTNYEELFGLVYLGSQSNLRNKLVATYKKSKKHTFYLGAELFRAIVNYRKPYFNKIRFTVGDKLSINKSNFNIGLGYERELNSDYPLNYFFTSVNYTFQLKKR